jgi:hypothetical protein
MLNDLLFQKIVNPLTTENFFVFFLVASYVTKLYLYVKVFTIFFFYIF